MKFVYPFKTNFGTGELRHKFQKISLTSAYVIILHCAEVDMPTELGAEVTPADHRWPHD